MKRRLSAVLICALSLGGAACSSSNANAPMVGCQIGGSSVAKFVQGSVKVRLTWDGWKMHGTVLPITNQGILVNTPKQAIDGGELSVLYYSREGKHLKAIAAKCTTADHGLTGVATP